MSQQVMDQFANEFRMSSGVKTFTGVGIKQFADSVEWKPNKNNPNPKITLARSAPTDPGARGDATWSMSVVKGAVDPNGWLQEWIGQAWIVLIFARWEEHYRQLFAEAAGVSKNQVTSDVMGDIRNLRNDVVHHNGIAGTNTRRNKILTRFAVGDRIVLTTDDIWLLSDRLNVAIENRS